MSEDINIVSAEFGVGGGLPEWANESTLQQILKRLEEAFDLNKSQSDSMKALLLASKKDAKLRATSFETDKKVLREMQNQGKKLNLSGSGDKLNLRGSRSRLGHNMFDTMTAGLAAAGAGLSTLTGELGLASTGVGKFGAFLKSAWSGPGAGFVAGLGLFGSILGQVLTSIKHVSGSMKNMAEYGVMVEGGLVEFAGAMADTGLTMEQLSALTEKYSAVIVSKGITGVVKLTKQVGQLAGGLDRYGLTTADATEYIAEYLDQQRLAGVFSRRSEMSQSQAIQLNIERLTAYSKILGVSRKQMEESAKTMLGRDDLQRMFFTMAPEEREKAMDAFKTVSDSMTSLGKPGEALLGIFTDMAATPIPFASESYKKIAQVAPDLAMQLVQMTEDMRAGRQVRVEDIISMTAQLRGRKDLIQAFANAGGEVAETANMLSAAALQGENAEKNLGEYKIKAAKEYNTTVEKLTNEQLTKYMSSVGEAASGAAKVEDAMNRFKATLEYSGIKAFTDLLGGEGKNAIDKMVDGLNSLTTKMREFVDADYFKKFGEMIRELTGTDGLAGILTTLGAVALGFGGLGTAIGLLGTALALFSTGLGAAGAVLMGGPAVWATAAIGGAIGYAGNRWYHNASEKDTDTSRLVSETAGYAIDKFLVMGRAVGLPVGEEAAERLKANSRARSEARYEQEDQQKKAKEKQPSKEKAKSEKPAVVEPSNKMINLFTNLLPGTKPEENPFQLPSQLTETPRQFPQVKIPEEPSKRRPLDPVFDAKMDDLENRLQGLANTIASTSNRSIGSVEEMISAFDSLGKPGEALSELFVEMAANPLPRATKAYQELSSVSSVAAEEFVKAAETLKKGGEVNFSELIKNIRVPKETLSAFSLASTKSAEIASNLSAVQIAQEIATRTAETQKANVGADLKGYGRELLKVFYDQAATQVDGTEFLTYARAQQKLADEQAKAQKTTSTDFATYVREQQKLTSKPAEAPNPTVIDFASYVKEQQKKLSPAKGLFENAKPTEREPLKVKQPEEVKDKPKAKSAEDLIQELISKGDNGEIDVLTDIRQLMAESVRKLERVESAIKNNGDMMS